MDIFGAGLTGGIGFQGGLGGGSLLGQILGAGSPFGGVSASPGLSPIGGPSPMLALMQFQMAQQMLSVYSQLGSLWGGLAGGGFGQPFSLSPGAGPLGFSVHP